MFLQTNIFIIKLWRFFFRYIIFINAFSFIIIFIWYFIIKFISIFIYHMITHYVIEYLWIFIFEYLKNMNFLYIFCSYLEIGFNRPHATMNVKKTTWACLWVNPLENYFYYLREDNASYCGNWSKYSYIPIPFVNNKV